MCFGALLVPWVFGSACLVVWVFFLEACLRSSVVQAKKETHQSAKVQGNKGKDSCGTVVDGGLTPLFCDELLYHNF